MIVSEKVGIVGAGSVAFGTAVLLCENGHDPMLWSPSGRGTADLAGGGLLTAKGAIDCSHAVRVARDAEDLVRGNLQKKRLHSTVEGQHVIISSHASLGAVYLAELLKARDVSAPITAWGTTAITGRRQSGTEVKVNTVRKLVDLCTVPDNQSSEALAICTRLFGDRFRARDGLLAISLSNLNPQNHMGIALCNMTRMERGETWSQGQNVTPNVGRLLEGLDLERIAIAKALDLEVRTIFEHFHLSFDVPVASISQMNQHMHAVGTGGTGPDTADSRYVTEDVPYGLVLTVALGDLVGRPAELHRAGVRIFSSMYGTDFMKENELLAALALERFTLSDLQRAARTGLLQGRDALAIQ